MQDPLGQAERGHQQTKAARPPEAAAPYRPSPVGASPGAQNDAAAETASPANGRSKQARHDPPKRLPGYVLAAIAYLGLGILAWWHLWSSGPSVSVPGVSGDATQGVWFLAWALHAIAHGQNPFVTHAIYAPGGVNLLDNPSILALGVALSPVTALIGPLVSFAIAVTLAPAASALAAFFLIRRYVKWQPAAFIGGLCYGFGPFVATDLRFGHLHLTFVALPPLIFLALDELLVRQVRDPRRVGAVLGALVIVQFFVSTEMLVLTALLALAGLLILAAANRQEAAGHFRKAVPGIVIGAAECVVVLAYPVWVGLAGPDHITGPVWPNIGRVTSTVAATIVPNGQRAGVTFISRGNGAYLGAGLVIILLGSLVVWPRNRLIRFAVAMTGIAFIASLGYSLHLGQADTHIPLPSAILGHLPVLDSVIPSHFGAFVDLFAGFSLALVLDRIRQGDLGVLQRLFDGAAATLGAAGVDGSAHGSSAKNGPASSRRAKVLAGLVAAAAIVPLAFAPPWPYPVTRAVEPALLTEAPISTLPSGSLVVEYSPARVSFADPMLWQALSGIPYDLYDGYAIIRGPNGRATEARPLDEISYVLAAGALGRLSSSPSSAEERAIRSGLSNLGARAVVVLPGSATAVPVAAVFAAVLGPPTRVSAGGKAWLLPAT